jgi:hypothetical protein
VHTAQARFFWAPVQQNRFSSTWPCAFCHSTSPLTYSFHSYRFLIDFWFKQGINGVGDLITFHYIKEIMNGTMNHVKCVSLQVRLPMFWNDIIEDFFGLVLREILIGFKWRELIKIIVEFDPPGAELTNHLIT